MALLNLIQLLETGRDLGGRENQALAGLADRAHLILIPCVNPDGRMRVPFRSVLGMDYQTFRYYDQGMWADGRICEWPEVKRIHPIAGHVRYLGGYFNDDGVNLMHDNFFRPMAAETRLMLDIASDAAPDFIVNFHGATGCDPSFCDDEFLPVMTRERLDGLEKQIQQACAAEHIPFHVAKKNYFPRTERPQGANLTWALHQICGGISLTHESQQGVIGNPPGNGCNEWDVGYEHIYREHMICIEMIDRFTQVLCAERKSTNSAKRQ